SNRLVNMRPFMDSKKKNDFPDLSLLASTFWISDPQYSPLNNHSSTHEIESLKLYAHIIWPAADMYNERRTFLAHCALRLQDKYNRTADLVRHRKDGLRRSAELRSWITQIYTHAADLGKEHLLLPFGGLDAALERGRIEIETD